MPGLNLTPRRLELLAAIGRGEVTRRRNWGHDPDEDRWQPKGERWRIVTAEVERFRAAGLAKTGRADHPSMYAPAKVELTAAGREALAAKES